MDTPTTEYLTPGQLADGIDIEINALRERIEYLTSLSLSVRNLSVRMVAQEPEQDVA